MAWRVIACEHSFVYQQNHKTRWTISDRLYKVVGGVCKWFQGFAQPFARVVAQGHADFVYLSGDWLRIRWLFDDAICFDRFNAAFLFSPNGKHVTVILRLKIRNQNGAGSRLMVSLWAFLKWATEAWPGGIPLNLDDDWKSKLCSTSWIDKWPYNAIVIRMNERQTPACQTAQKVDGGFQKLPKNLWGWLNNETLSTDSRCFSCPRAEEINCPA